MSSDSGPVGINWDHTIVFSVLIFFQGNSTSGSKDNTTVAPIVIQTRTYTYILGAFSKGEFQDSHCAFPKVITGHK